jgi:hypothetical protein
MERRGDFADSTMLIENRVVNLLFRTQTTIPPYQPSYPSVAGVHECSLLVEAFGLVGAGTE